MSQETEDLPNPKWRRCCCCGSAAWGRQWPNQDTGFGLCRDCVDFCHRNMSDDEFERTYGKRGVHYDLPDQPEN